MVLLIQFGLVEYHQFYNCLTVCFLCHFRGSNLHVEKVCLKAVIINVFFVYTGRYILYEMIIDPYCIAKQKMTKKNQREKSESTTFTYLIS